jgi:16S rRNA (cytosine1402-N4)-methyltransferase
LLPSALQRSRTDHVPVLADEVRGLLAVTPGETVVDATFGAGGHARVLAADLKGKGRFIAIDRDSTVRPFYERFEREAGVQARFLRGELSVVLTQLGANRVEADAILIDLGVSSMQIDRPDRGFSYAVDAPLDMRMDPGAPRTAADVVNTYPPKDLARVLRVYGEERFASRIAAAIDRERIREPFTNTARLAELVRESIPAATRRTGGHPAKRTFQALRIEVNDELGALERALPAAVDALAIGGRVVVITFHSLEDRIVKQTLAADATDRTPPEFPVPVPELGPVLRLLTRGGEAATDAETAANPRAASARVRAAERIRRAA